MSIKASLLVEVEAGKAKAELKSTGKAAETLGKSAEAAGRKSKSGAAGTKALGDSANRAKSQVRQLSAAEVQAANTVGKMGRANGLAAGQVGNLTSQFNGIGVMLAAGQSPLQLALQQGTQITQVIGPLGAGGAVKALGAAFVQMINPVSLITIGSIAAGAAMVNWLRSAGPEAISLDDILEQLTESVDAYTTAAGLARSSTADLEVRFGSASDKARGLQGNVAELERSEAIKNMATAAASLVEQFGGLSRTKLVVRFQGGVMKEIEATMGDIRSEFELTEQQAGSVTLALEAINNAKTPDDAIAAAKEFSDVLLTVFGSASQVPEVLREAALAAAKLATEGGKILSEDEARLRAAKEALATQRETLGELVRSVAVRVKGNLANLASARALLQTLNSENAIRAAILAHGEDSAQVAKLRQQAERRVFEEGLKTRDVSEKVKDELRAAFEEGQKLASLDMASGIDAAATAAGRLADNLELARGKRLDKLVGGNVDFFDPRNESGLSGVVQRDRRNPQDQIKRRDARTSASGSKQEGDALKRLTQSLRDELAILRETDPVQKEMLKNREALKGATEQERQSIADLIAQRNNEALALENHQQAVDLFNSTTASAIDALSQKGGSLSDVFDSLATSIRRAALQAIILGEGPLSGLLGNSGSGGLAGGLGGLAGSLLNGFNLNGLAAGGIVHGPGSGTSDDVLIKGSQGEFMVNAKATQKHRGLLELINAGSPIPGFAQGGIVAPDFMRARSSANFGSAPAPQIIIDNRSSTQVTGEIEETVGSGGQRSSRLVLADAVGDALKTRGGGADRVLRKDFGIAKRGALR